MIAMVQRIMDGTYPARPVGFVRIVLGVAALVRGIEAARILIPLTEDRVVKFPYAGWLPEPTLPLVAVLLVGWLVAAVGFTFGFRTRATGTVLAVSMGSSLFLDQQAYSNHLYLLAVLVALLTVANAGSALSLDARRNGERHRLARWPIELMKLQVSVVYGFAALTKLNEEFLSGAVIADFLGRGVIPVPASQIPSLALASVALTAVVIEFSLAVLLWIPSRRHIAVGLGTVFHLSIPLLLIPFVQLVVFSSVMLACYLLFLEVEPRSRTLIWDDGCPHCNRIKGLLERADLLQAIRFVGFHQEPHTVAELGVSHTDADRALQLVSEDRTEEGFDAMAGALAVTPMGYLAAPFLQEPGIRATGRRYYKRQASRRKCGTVGVS